MSGKASNDDSHHDAQAVKTQHSKDDGLGSSEIQKAPEPYSSKFMVNSDLNREYFAVAPMVDVSDKYFRYFMRLLTKHAWLYTEMVNENAVLHAC